MVTQEGAEVTANAESTVPADGGLATQALRALLTALPVRVRVANVRGVIEEERQGESRIASPGELQSEPLTLRALWEQQRPSQPGQDVSVPFAETPAMRALGGDVVIRERLAVSRDGDRVPLLVSATPLHDDAGMVTGVVVMEEAAPEERLAVVGHVVSKLMHDVNNVLSPIMASAFLLNHHAVSPSAVREYAERIRLALESGTALSTRVARFVRQEPVHAGGDVPIELGALVDDVLTEMLPRDGRRAHSNAITLVREPGEALYTRGLEAELRVAVGHVVQNALDAMRGAGTLTVRTFRSRGDVCVTVRDSGAGMSADARLRGFEPFFTTRGAGSAGLGLSEMYGILKRHRGSATIEPQDDSGNTPGTAVTLRLPAALPVAAPPPLPAAPAGGVDGGPTDRIAKISAVPRGETAPIHVLVVEDHDDGRDLLVRLLRTAGHTVQPAATCAEAKRLLADELALPYHLLLTDVGLPDGNGWALVSYARARCSGLRVGVMTGWAGEEDEIDTREVEFVLRKPLRAAELLAHVAGGVRSTTR